MYKHRPIIFFLLLMAIAPAWITVFARSGELPWKPEPVVGCWVRYHLTLPRNHPLHGSDLTCLVKVLAVDGRKLSLEYVVEGLPRTENAPNPTITVNDDDFDPARAFGLSVDNGHPAAPSTPVKFRVRDLQKDVDAQKLVTASAVDKDRPELEVIRSKDIPFGLARLSSKGVTLEVVGFSWGEKKSDSNN